MWARWVITALTVSLLLLLPGTFLYAQEYRALSPIYAFWRGDNLLVEDLDNMRQLHLEGCLLPAVRIEYISETGGLSPSPIDIRNLENEEAIGIEFYIVAEFELWDSGWDGQPGIQPLSFITGDICKSVIDQIEKASGTVKGLVIRSLDTEPDLKVLADILEALRGHPAYQWFEDLQFGSVVEPDWVDYPGYSELSEAADILVGNFTAQDPLGELPTLVEKAWVVSGAKKLNKKGKSFLVSLPLYEQVIQYDDTAGIINPDVSISFDTLIDAADNISTDSAGNTVAEFTAAATMEELPITPGMKFVHLKVNPGKLTEIVKALYENDLQNLVGIALDGFPYEPSADGHPASVYVSSLKGATPSSISGVTQPTPAQQQQIEKDIKAQSKAFWFLALLLLIAIILTGLSVWRKGKLTYNEETGKLERNGGEDG